MNINDTKLNIEVWLCLRIKMIKMTHSIQNFAIISYALRGPGTHARPPAEGRDPHLYPPQARMFTKKSDFRILNHMIKISFPNKAL